MVARIKCNTKAPIRGRKRRIRGDALLNSGVKATLWHWRDVDFSVAGDITWANGGYQQRHYGVTTSQQRTDFSVYRPSFPGFQLGGVSTGLVWHISENVAAG